MQPIFFKPVYKDYIWGGNNIEKYFNRNLNNEKIAESWELSAHKHGLSVVTNGKYREKTLLELFEDVSIRKEIFGTRCEKMDKFPILIKFIDATDKLSIQVHPNDEYAKKYEKDLGKTECWYILNCNENAKIICGLNNKAKNKTNNELIENIEEYVEYVNIKKGDFITIPSGTVHATLDGVLICEVQQSSDITYRVFDWNRLGKDGKPRELHKDKAVEVIKKNDKVEIKNYDNIINEENAYESKEFNVKIIKINKNKKFHSNSTSFEAYVVIDGEGEIISENFKERLVKGNTFLISANLGDYEINGNIKLIKVWI